MNNLLDAILYSVLSLFLGFILACELVEYVVGTEISDLRTKHELCEKELPRNQTCEFIAVPSE